MKRVILKEVNEEPKDLGYEIRRAIKTLFVITMVFFVGFVFKKNYNDMLENSRNMRFYPASTVLYIDGLDAKEVAKEFGLSEKKVSQASYGIFKDKHGEDKFLIAVFSPDEEDTHIITKKGYSLLTSQKYTFISNSEETLSNVKECQKTKKYNFMKNKNIKHALKTLAPYRVKTIIVDDVSYVGIPINYDARKAMNKIFDKIIIQTFEDFNTIEFSGEVTFNSKMISVATKLNNLREKFAKRSIKIEQYNKKNLAMTVGVKDFDIWSTTLMKLVKSMPDNQYNATLSLIQSIFNFDIEKDIVEQLNGSAVLYIYSDKKNLHPMLLLETKKDLAVQGKKYLNFLQLTNNSKLSEKQLHDRTFNVLSSGFYPHNLSFGSLDDNMFILGHQSIIEKFLDNENEDYTIENCDIYFYSNIKKLSAHNKKVKNKSFWNNYKTIEIKAFISPSINFSGKITK